MASSEVGQPLPIDANVALALEYLIAENAPGYVGLTIEQAAVVAHEHAELQAAESAANPVAAMEELDNEPGDHHVILDDAGNVIYVGN